MGSQTQPWRSRREFLKALTGLATASVVDLRSECAVAEPPMETTRLRLPRYSYDVACIAPQWVAEELLRTEGFANVEYVLVKETVAKETVAGLEPANWIWL